LGKGGEIVLALRSGFIFSQKVIVSEFRLS